MVDTPKSETQLTINGQAFELKNMSAENGARLYVALGQVAAPTNYQQLADQIAGFVRHFKSIQSISLPAGMDLQKFLDGFAKALREGGGKLKPEAESIYRELQNSELGKFIQSSGLYKSGQAAAGLASNIGSFATGLLRPIDTALTAVDAVTKTGGELLDQAGFSISDSQARAVGAAYAASIYAATDAPDSPAQTRRRNPTLIDEWIAKGTTFFSDLWVKLPSEWTARLAAVIPWVLNGFSDWDKHYATALAEATDERAKPRPTYEQRLARQVEEAIDKQKRPIAVDLLRKAEAIAGLETKPMADAMGQDRGVVYRAQNGTFYSLRFEQGKPKSEPLKDSKGRDVTLARRIATEWEQIVDAAVPQNTADTLGAAAGLALTGKGAAAIAPTVGSAAAGVLAGAATLTKSGAALTTGVISGIVEAPANLAATRTGWKAEQKAEQAVLKLQKEQEALKESLKAAKANLAELEANKPEGVNIRKSIERSRAANKVASLETDLKKIDESLNGRKGWFGRHVKGALELAQEAREATNAHMQVPSKFARMQIADSIVEAGKKTQQAVGEGLSWAMSKIGIHSTETLAEAAPKMMRWGTSVGKVVGKASVYVGPVLSTGELVHGIKNNNGREITTSATELGTIGTAGLAGLAIGGPAGGLIGLAVGGIASLATGWGAGKVYDNLSEEAAPTGALPADPAMTPVLLQQEAHTAKAQARMAEVAAGAKSEIDIAKAAVNRAQFACVGSNALGAMVCPEGLPMGNMASANISASPAA